MASLELFDYATTGKIYEEGHAIRLVQLIKGSGPKIVCHLIKSFIHEAGIPYEALSYTWGSSEKTKLVTLNDKSFWVTENLYEALQSLRREDEDRILWIDAMCINQGHVEERNHQVMHMASIYQEAERVIFWLGPSTQYMDILMNSLKCLQRRALKNGCHSWALEDKRWREMWLEFPWGNSLKREHLAGLKTALERSWFRRVWILQECAHAKAGIVACGRNYVAAQMFVLAPSLMQVSVGPHCQQVLEIMPGFRGNRLRRDQLEFFDLLLKFQHSEASEERDKLYALYSMASDNERLPVMNYGQPLSELFTDMFRTFFPFHRWQIDEIHTLYRYEEFHPFVSNLEKFNNVAMICAAQKGELSVLEKLHTRVGSNVNFIDENGNSTLLMAAQFAHIDIVRFLLSISSINVNIKDHEQRTPLHRSVITLNFEMVKLFLSSETVDINSQDRYGNTPLHLAVVRKDKEIVQLFVRHPYINPDIEDNNGKTPLIVALKLEEDELAHVLGFSRDNIIWKAWHAIETGQIETYYRLVQEIGIFATVSPVAFQDLMRPQRELVRLLSRIDDKKVVNARDSYKCTILMQAIQKGYIDLAIELLKYPIIDVTAQVQNEYPLLTLAISMDKTYLFDALLNHREININTQNQNGDSPLAIAVLQNNTYCFDALLGRSEININTQNQKGDSPLAIAVLQKNTYCFDALLGRNEIIINTQTKMKIRHSALQALLPPKPRPHKRTWY